MIKTRKKFGLSQGELSRRLGFSAAYLSDLEGGKRKWRQELIDKYLKACER